jgi:hypothetical protein
LIEGAPTKGRTRLDDFIKAACFIFAQGDRFTGSQVMSHDLGKQRTAAADLRCKSLADDISNAVGQSQSLLLFFTD